MQLVLFGGFSFGKNMEKLMFFSEQLWLDWGNTERAAMAGLESKGLEPAKGGSFLSSVMWRLFWKYFRKRTP